MIYQRSNLHRRNPIMAWNFTHSIQPPTREIDVNAFSKGKKLTVQSTSGTGATSMEDQSHSTSQIVRCFDKQVSSQPTDARIMPFASDTKVTSMEQEIIRPGEGLGTKRKLNSETDDDLIDKMTNICIGPRKIGRKVLDQDEINFEHFLKEIRHLPLQIQLSRLIERNDANSLSRIQALINHTDCSVNDSNWFSPLTLAATKDDTDIFDFILAHSEHSSQNRYSGQALFNVCKHMTGEKQRKRCGQLLEKGWDFNELIGQLSTLEQVALSGTDFSFMFTYFPKHIDLKASNEQGQTLFELVLKGKNKKMIKFIMNHVEFEPVFEDQHHSSYITYACREHLIDIAYDLLERHPEAALMHSIQWGTPLQTLANLHWSHTAMKTLLLNQQYHTIIQSLLKKKADINHQTCFLQGRGPWLPIQLSAIHLNTPCARALIVHKADLSVVAYDNSNLLHLAAHSAFGKQYGSPELIEMLMLLTPHFERTAFDARAECHFTANQIISKLTNSDKIFTILQAVKPMSHTMPSETPMEIEREREREMEMEMSDT